jgi:hypothetical protein
MPTQILIRNLKLEEVKTHCKDLLEAQLYEGGMILVTCRLDKNGQNVQGAAAALQALANADAKITRTRTESPTSPESSG